MPISAPPPILTGIGPYHDGIHSPSWTVTIYYYAVAGVFVLDQSLLDSATDLLGGTWVSQQVVTTDVLEAHVRRGRARENLTVDPGELTLVLDNVAGWYGPDATMGPWVSPFDNRTLLRAGVYVELAGTWASTTYPIFRGYLSDLVPNYDTEVPTVTLVAVDALAQYFARTYPVITPAAYLWETGGARAARVAATVGFGLLPLETFNIGNVSRPLMADAGGGVGKDQLDLIAAGEGGRYYVDRLGALTVLPHSDVYTRTRRLYLADRDVTADAQIDALTIDPSLRSYANQSRVQRNQLPDVTAIDPTSSYTMAPVEVTVVTALMLDTDTSLIATYYATRRSQPTPRVAATTFEALGNITNYAGLLSLELGDRVTVTAVYDVTRSWSCATEGVQYDILPDSWQVTLNTAALDTFGVDSTQTTFTLDRSLLDSIDVLGAF